MVFQRGWHGPHTTQMKSERNEQLRAAFVAGATARELMARFQVTRARVYQLTKGLKRAAREQAPIPGEG